MKIFFASLALVAVAAFAEIGTSPVIGAERTRNLRGLDYAPMLMEYHRQTVGEGRHFFTYPRRDTTFRKNFEKNNSNAMAYFKSEDSSSHQFAIAVSPVFGPYLAVAERPHHWGQGLYPLHKAQTHAVFQSSLLPAARSPGSLKDLSCLVISPAGTPQPLLWPTGLALLPAVCSPVGP